MSNLCPFPQHQRLVDDAAAIVLNPGEHTRTQYLLAWSCLKAARGQTVHQSRLNAMPAQTTPPVLVLRHPIAIGGAA
jgi:hypothetical protein